MHGEVTELKRCCFCLPLRRGLIGWGYVKLVSNTLEIIYFMMFFYWWYWDRKYTILATNIIVTSLIIDLFFNVILIVAGHKKSVKLYKVSYIYNFMWFVLVLLGYCYLLYLDVCLVYSEWQYFYTRIYLVFILAIGSALVFGTLFVQIYLILLIRSEIKKLRNQSLEIQFTNLTVGEPRCTLHNASDIDGTGKKLIVQDCMGKEYVV